MAQEWRADQMPEAGGGHRTDVPAGTGIQPRTSRAEVRRASRDLRRQELIEAALRVVRREGPAASMEQIAAEAAVSKPVIYRYFSDRADLVAAVGEHAFERIRDAMQKGMADGADPVERVAGGVDAYLAFIEQDYDVYRFVLRSGSLPDGNLVLTDYLRRLGREVAGTVRTALASAGLDPSPAEIWGFGIVGMVHATADWWIEEGTMDRQELGRHLTSMIIFGASAEITSKQPRRIC